MSVDARVDPVDWRIQPKAAPAAEISKAWRQEFPYSQKCSTPERNGRHDDARRGAQAAHHQRLQESPEHQFLEQRPQRNAEAAIRITEVRSSSSLVMGLAPAGR